MPPFLSTFMSQIAPTAVDPLAERDARRAKELQAAREQYVWKPMPGLPSTVERLPSHEGPPLHELQVTMTMAGDLLRGAGMVAWNVLRTMNQPGNTLSVFTRLHHHFGETLPPAWERWATDAGFVSSVINGMTPEYLERVDPRNPAMRNDNDLQDFLRQGERLPPAVLPQGVGLRDLYNHGQLYIINLRFWLRDAPPREEGADVSTSPIVAFYVDHRTQLLTVIAIQLTAGGPLFHPALHSPMLWLAAKLHVGKALTAVAPRTHLLAIHMGGSGLVIAARRNLAAQHPVLAMLEPHLSNHLYSTARLNAPGTAAFTPLTHHVIQKEWQRVTEHRDGDTIDAAEDQPTLFDTCHLPRSIKRRGLDDEAALPGYMYRDHGLLVWGAIAQYAEAVVDAVYASDKAVMADTEVQQWLAEAADPAKGHVTGLPKCDSRAALAEIITWLIFLCSAYHGYATVAGQHYFGFMLTNPPTFNFDPPRTLRDLRQCEPTAEEIRAALPSLQTAANLAAGISAVRGNWYLPLMELPPETLSEVKGGPEAVRRFVSALERIDGAMRRPTPVQQAAAPGYDYWLPSKMSACVWA